MSRQLKEFNVFCILINIRQRRLLLCSFSLTHKRCRQFCFLHQELILGKSKNCYVFSPHIMQLFCLFCVLYDNGMEGGAI